MIERSSGGDRQEFQTWWPPEMRPAGAATLAADRPAIKVAGWFRAVDVLQHFGGPTCYFFALVSLTAAPNSSFVSIV
jgi:hypothetical protein